VPRRRVSFPDSRAGRGTMGVHLAGRGPTMAIPHPHHLFTVDDYYKMAESGILREDDRVELIDGEIIAMAPIGSGHAGTVDQFGDNIRELVSGRGRVRSQNPIRLGFRAEPEPDLVIVRPRTDFYRNGHPGPEDIMLVIEVSESSLVYDRQTKAPLYARAGIIEYWIVNLIDRVIEVYRDPSDGQYQRVEIVRRGEHLHPLAFPDVTIAVDDVLL
jgi:Uma2 family endonuclease